MKQPSLNSPIFFQKSGKIKVTIGHVPIEKYMYVCTYIHMYVCLCSTALCWSSTFQNQCLKAAWLPHGSLLYVELYSLLWLLAYNSSRWENIAWSGSVFARSMQTLVHMNMHSGLTSRIYYPPDQTYIRTYYSCTYGLVQLHNIWVGVEWRP